MHALTTISAVVALALTVQAQTPDDYPPSSENTLRAVFNKGDGSEPLVIEPNEFVSPTSETCPFPMIGLLNQEATTQKYIVVMLDVSINATLTCAQIDCSTQDPSTWAPGLEAGRTTYLHWFQGNLTQPYLNGFLNTSQTAYNIAPYINPQPPVDDDEHTYVFYVFEQPDGYCFEDGGKDLKTKKTADRIGFDVRPIAEEVGGVRAGDYFRVKGDGSSC